VYQGLLTRKYLTRKIMPMLSAIAVCLCVAMVLITWSVMGGFLKNLLEAGRGLMGDIKIVAGSRGFPHYEQLITMLEADPQIEAAAPVIEAPGTITLPSGEIRSGMLTGIDPLRHAKVTKYAEANYWKALDKPERLDEQGLDPRLRPLDELLAGLWGSDVRDIVLDETPTWGQLEQQSQTLTRRGPDGAERGGVALGIRVSGLNYWQRGWYLPSPPVRTRSDGVGEWLPQFLPLNGDVTVTAYPLSPSGVLLEPVSRVLPVTAEFQTGVAQVDASLTVVRLDILQRMLNMHETSEIVREGGIVIDPQTGEERFDPGRTRPRPARVSAVLVKGARGVDIETLRARTLDVYTEFHRAHPDQIPPANRFNTALTWEDLNSDYVSAVKNETGVVLFVFTFISVTAVFLVWAIFWSMVSEKVRDIGILRAIGASGRGVIWLWLRYALCIGIIGALAGVGLAYAIVNNINEIHDWMGRSLGIYLWDPSVYVLTEIPDEVNPQHAWRVALGGVLSAAIGAMAPAIRAARLDPVKALRHE